MEYETRRFGSLFSDSAEIYNLSNVDWRDESTWTETDNGTITLYAQWRKSESTLVIDAAGENIAD